MDNIVLDGSNLTIEKLLKVSESTNIKVSICPKAKEKIETSRKYVLDKCKEDKTYYGINTGFGALSNKKINSKDLSALQYNLIRSHCTGVGQPYNRQLTRAIMLLRANCLTRGFSGCSLETIELILNLLNHNVYAKIPSRGSVGASGDLAPLSHLALCLIGEGELFYNGKWLNSAFVLEQLNLKPLILGPKDGLSLINGTAVLTALGAYAAGWAKRLIKIADIAGAITLDSIKGSIRPFNPLIHSLKPHEGQINSAKNLLSILDGSQIGNSHHDCNKVQDPYSLRCMPQVHGAARLAVSHVCDVITTELNSVTDNPLIFVQEDTILSGGNFHGEAVSIAMDYLSIALSELSSISERRIEKLMNPVFSELPAFLAPDSGLNSGFMISHVTSAALASENRTLSHPASVDNIPTSTDKEDHVSMGVTAGLKLQQIVENTTNVLAIEILCGLQALDFNRPLTSSKAIEEVYKLVRAHVPFVERDQNLSILIARVSDLISNDEIISRIEKHTGVLL